MGVVTAEAATAAVGLGFALLKGGCLSASLSHATVRLTCSLGQSLLWPILVTPQKSVCKEIILLHHFSPMHEPCRPLSNKGTTCGDYGSPPSFGTVEKAGGANQADRGWSASKAVGVILGYTGVYWGILRYTGVHRGWSASNASTGGEIRCLHHTTLSGLRTSMQSFCIHCHDSKIARRPCLVSMTE